jgi:hypothetical protein
MLSAIIHNLARFLLPPGVPYFAEVCAIVEQIEGVRFQELFAKLPKKAPDGDAAIEIVWEMAKNQGQEILRTFGPLLKNIVAVALGDQEMRAQIEEIFPELEEKGWRITSAVQRIWAGERDAQTLTTGLYEQDAALVRRVLELIKTLES